MTRIHLSKPHLGELEARYVAEALETNWVSTVGPHLPAFEASLSELLGGQACVALSSGTAAIHLGLKLLGVDRDDEVICASLTFAASANPISYLGARPVFVDSEPATWNLDPELVAEAIEDRIRRGRRPKAVVVVHLYGQAADLDRLEAVCQRHDIPMLEDAAEALGTHYRGTQVGVRGAVSAFSFNGNKIITTSGGGALASHDRGWIDRARFWATQAREPVPWYEHRDIGFNYRMSNVLAGIGRGQLAVLEDRVQARRRIGERYRAAFSDLPGFVPMPEPSWSRSTRWLSVFTVEPSRLGCSRDDLLAALEQQDIEGRPVWKPLHLQPVFAACPAYGGRVSEQLFSNGICLPSSSSLTDDEQHRVIEVIRGVCGR